MKKEPNTMENLTKEQAYHCDKCGSDINHGEFVTFGVCDDCFDKNYKERTASGSVAAPKEEPKENKKTPQEFFIEKGKTESMVHALRLLVNKCIQYERGKIIGFDSDSFSSLAPIIMSPFTDKSELSSLRDQLRQRDELIKELLDIAERHVYMHGNDDSVTDRRQTIARAKTILGI